MDSKIKTLAALRNLVTRLKSKGKRIVFTNGCFDLLHYGHVRYLQDAKKEGDILIVAINSDASVKRIKGVLRPIVSQRYRSGLIAALESVDYVTIFNDDTPIKVIESIRPGVLVKGADWNAKDIVGRDVVIGYGGKVKTIKLIKGLSTTNLIKKIARKSRK